MEVSVWKRSFRTFGSIGSFSASPTRVSTNPRCYSYQPHRSAARGRQPETIQQVLQCDRVFYTLSSPHGTLLFLGSAAELPPGFFDQSHICYHSPLAHGCLSAISNLGYLYLSASASVYLCFGTFCYHCWLRRHAHVTAADSIYYQSRIEWCARLIPFRFMVGGPHLAPGRTSRHIANGVEYCWRGNNTVRYYVFFVYFGVGTNNGRACVAWIIVMSLGSIVFHDIDLKFG